jgi:hypothetical protein
MTDCVFELSNNKLSTVSGADTGTYIITDNIADILISGITNSVNPFDRAYLDSVKNSQITDKI